MPKLTITLSAKTHRALSQVAELQGRSIDELIEESLQRSGIKPADEIEAMLWEAGRRAAMDEESALELAVEVTRKVREQRTREHAGEDSAQHRVAE